MSELSQHAMQLEITHPSGAEEWACAECGRRILMQWPPNYKRVVLEPGDEFAIHSGSKGGLNVSSPLVEEADAPELSEEMRAALEEALKDVDFDAPSSADDS